MREKRRTAAICGTFDVNNYGDLLFPVMAAAQLEPHGWDVIAVSPTSGPTTFEDAQETRPLLRLLDPEAMPDAVLIGGGEIVHNWSGEFLREYQAEALAASAYLSLWYGAAVAAALIDAPIVWNAPGVPVPLGRPLRRDALLPALAASDYVAVRDATSSSFMGREASPEVVPDTIAGLARIWPRAALQEPFRRFAERKQLQAGARIIAVHVRPERSGRTDIVALGAELGAFAAARGLTPVLTAIGPSLNDGEALQRLSRALVVAHVLLDDPQSLAEIAAIIAHSTLYIGNSMHGYVTAAAYDVPGVVVARPGFRKYQGFARHIRREADIVRAWDKALLRAAEVIDLRQGTLIPGSVHDALDRHWSRIATAIADREIGRQRRADFLRGVLANGLRQSGIGWLTQGLGRPDRPTARGL